MQAVIQFAQTLVQAPGGFAGLASPGVAPPLACFAAVPTVARIDFSIVRVLVAVAVLPISIVSKAFQARFNPRQCPAQPIARAVTGIFAYCSFNIGQAMVDGLYCRVSTAFMVVVPRLCVCWGLSRIFGREWDFEFAFASGIAIIAVVVMVSVFKRRGRPVSPPGPPRSAVRGLLQAGNDGAFAVVVVEIIGMKTQLAGALADRQIQPLRKRHAGIPRGFPGRRAQVIVKAVEIPGVCFAHKSFRSACALPGASARDRLRINGFVYTIQFSLAEVNNSLTVIDFGTAH